MAGVMSSTQRRPRSERAAQCERLDGVRAHLAQRTGWSQRLRAAAGELDELLSEIDPGACDADETLVLLSLFARVRRVGATGEAMAARRAEATNAHRSTGHPSGAHLLAEVSGTTVGRATEAVDTAKRLESCTATADALRAGEISLEQAAAVSRAAQADPSAEADLLRFAGRESVRRLQDRARDVRLAADDDRLGRYRRQCAARYLRHGRTDDGMVWGHFELPPDTGAAVVHAIERRADRHFEAAHRDGRRETPDHTRADALVSLVTRSDDTSSGRAAGASTKRSGDEASSKRGDSGRPSAQRPSAEIVVHVSYDALVRGSVNSSVAGDADEICAIRGAGPIPVEVARAYLDDAFLKAVVVDGVDVRTVKHFGRTIPAAVRTALEVREVVRHGDVVCADDRCDRTLGLEWDHVRPVARGGATSYDNLQPLCRHHHRAKTATDAARAGPAP